MQLAQQTAVLAALGFYLAGGVRMVKQRKTGKDDTTQSEGSPEFTWADLEKWLKQVQESGDSMGGYACGYYPDGWCGCACGNNENNTDCYLPPIEPGIAGTDRMCGCIDGGFCGCVRAQLFDVEHWSYDVRRCPTGRLGLRLGKQCGGSDFRGISQCERHLQCEYQNASYSNCTKVLRWNSDYGVMEYDYHAW